jgi:hypothetical protein
VIRSLEEARRYLKEVGILARTPQPGFPSLFGAIRSRPYKEGSRGFGTWPKDEWWWGGELEKDADVLALKILDGKSIFVHRRLWAPLDGYLRRFRPALSPLASSIRNMLARHGPTRTDVLRQMMGFRSADDGRLYHLAIGQLERLGVVLKRAAAVEAHVHVGELMLWRHRFPKPIRRWKSPVHALAEWLSAVSQAAGKVDERRLLSWFSWPRADLDKALGILRTDASAGR